MLLTLSNVHDFEFHVFKCFPYAAFRFELRHADGDILQLMESSVPPADISRVGIFAQPLAKYHKEVGIVKLIWV